MDEAEGAKYCPQRNGSAEADISPRQGFGASSNPFCASAIALFTLSEMLATHQQSHFNLVALPSFNAAYLLLVACTYEHQDGLQFQDEPAISLAERRQWWSGEATAATR